MSEVRFIHCADIHLDAPFTSLGGNTDKSASRRQDIKDTFQEIIDLAKSEKPDLLFICGDLYEYRYVRKSTINFLNNCFKSIPDTRIFIIPGNHDPITVNSYYKNFNWNSNVFILCDEMPYVGLDDLNVYIYGAGFKSFSQEKTMVYDLKPVRNDYINILLTHGTVDMNVGNCLYNPMSSENLSSLSMDYIALGHFHGRIDDIGGKGIIFNPGSPEPLGFDEPGGHGVYIGSLKKSESGERSLDLRFVKLNKRFYESSDVRLDGCGSNEEVIAKLSEAIKVSDPQNCLLYITLKGYVENGFKIDVRQISAYFRDKLYYLKLKDETLVNYNLEELVKEPGLKGLFVRKLISRMENTDDQYEKTLLSKALYYGLEALENGKIEI